MAKTVSNKKVDNKSSKPRSKSVYSTFSGTHIGRMLNKVDSERRISSTCKHSFSQILEELLGKITETAVNMKKSKVSGGKTVNAGDVLTATRLLMSEELAKHTVVEATKTLVKYRQKSE